VFVGTDTVSSHHAKIHFRHSAGSFADKSYSRDHALHFKGGIVVRASSATGFGGSPDAVDPEDAFTGALSSCHMLTFLAVAAVKGFEVAEYVDEAEGTLDRNADGRMAMTRVVLRPRVSFNGRQPTAEELAALHGRAHKGCFIANSVITPVEVEIPEA
jgi:organic hydroperoxide reductase OsmC/OhrA